MGFLWNLFTVNFTQKILHKKAFKNKTKSCNDAFLQFGQICILMKTPTVG